MNKTQIYAALVILLQLTDPKSYVWPPLQIVDPYMMNIILSNAFTAFDFKQGNMGGKRKVHPLYQSEVQLK